MQILKKISEIFYKGRRFFLLPFFMLVFSCVYDDLHQGKVSFHNTANRNSFSFSISEEFVEVNSQSKPDKNHPKMSVAEAKLLFKILKKQKYCLDKSDSPNFVINGRQEKIYDMTFAHLIEQNYKARPVTPKTYFGECVD